MHCEAKFHCLSLFLVMLCVSPLQRSEAMPYTHPMPIANFISTIVGSDLFLVTAGGEGTIRTWRFNPASGSFEHIMLLEGHTRGVTSLVLQG